ncbi:MAG TPA: thrombospondin, partial [Labilithrix sp.]|nr:thrombospondin [Labilithrix sp.]
MAHAQQCSNPLVSTCINSDTFWPHAGPQRFAAVGSAETVADRQVAFGLVTSYQSRPIIINGPSPGGAGSEHFAIDNQVNANFLFAYGVTNRLQLDLGLPITLVQTGAGTSPLTGGAPIRDTAVRDMRFGFAYALIPRQRIDLRKAADE